MPKTKEQKYTPKLASKTGCSRSALEAKHNTTVFTSLCILSQNMRITAVRLNMNRGNSKKSPATPLQTGKMRSFQLRWFVSAVVLHCPVNQIKRKPCNSFLKGENRGREGEQEERERKRGSSLQWFLTFQLTGFRGMLMFYWEIQIISLSESIRRRCFHVPQSWSICQDSWFPGNQLSTVLFLNHVALKLLTDTSFESLLSLPTLLFNPGHPRGRLTLFSS